jgi:hypothetical protein
MDRRRFICMALTTSVVVSLPLFGCGWSSGTVDSTPERTKAIMKQRLGVEDPSLLPKTASKSKVKKHP